MSKSIKIIFIKQHPTDKEGTIQIRTIEDRKPKKKSLGIKVKETEFKKYFNQQKQRFNTDKRFTRHEEINQIIDAKLKELSANDNEISYLPDEKKSFTKYWDKYIKTIENYGTKIKHQGVQNKLNKFLANENKTGLLFSEISPTLLREIKLYFSKSKDPKSLSGNTAGHYLKIIKSVYNKAAKDEYFISTKDPFLSLKFPKTKTIKNVLTAEELSLIIKSINHDEDFNTIKNMFLFQVFNNGMRVSDLLLLRWNNFEEERLNYKMFKTDYNINIPLNPMVTNIIYDDLKIKNKQIRSFNSTHQLITDESGNTTIWSIDKIAERIKLIAHDEYKISDYNKNRFEKMILEGKMTKYKNNFTLNKKYQKELVRLLDAQIEIYKKIDADFTSQLFSLIIQNKANKLNDFVFPILKNEDFSDIDNKNDFTKISLLQYKKIKHGSIVYNRKLKKIQSSLNIKSNITSHVARNSFTNLLLTLDNVNLYDISQSLGHANITITQNYISSGFNLEKLDYINKQLATKFRFS